ncbi:CRAL-TRIO domain-containing protein C23B6.04c [Hypsizygus marmoreus]|uniref:CRAL-TRIO domain-containing protein C23B6.04c n=1 Tax=Hypsizygus marmoreus TaxID=39966 RepID=A0A369K395_HYPMA|nr:CRAL-TRIO domain-containing protein C23B6.04c [Hypsizygus marmoreus]
MSEKVHEPIHPPRGPCETDPRANLTDVQRVVYNQVLEHFSEPAYTIPGLDKGQLTEDEQFWLSSECLLRYLRASKWKTPAAAIHRLEATLKWRREFGLYDLVTASHVEPEAVTGKEILFGYDVRGRPAFYMFPSRQNTNEATRQIQFAVWMLERSIDLMAPGVETVDLLINYGDKSKSGPSFSVARTVLSILQEHYPERLGAALILNVPFLLNAFYKLINPFIDPVSREKMKFNPEVVEDGIFTGDMVMAEWWGGARDFEYVHEKYWPTLVGMCEVRRQAWMEQWRALGGKVGVKEWEYKNGTASSASASAEKAQIALANTAEVSTSEKVNVVVSAEPAQTIEPISA